MRLFRALRLRRDVHALFQIRPEHGVAGVLPELRCYAGMDAAVSSSLKKLDGRMARLASGIPANSVYGAWEGAIAAVDVSSTGAGDVEVLQLPYLL